MQSMDRNTVIGFVLLAILLFAYLYISTKNSNELQAKQKAYEDSIAKVQAKNQAPVQKADSAAIPVITDSTNGLKNAIYGKEELTTVETDLLKITFTNKGAQPAGVELKNYQSYDSTPVQLVNNATRISYQLTVEKNKSAAITDLYFPPAAVTKNNDGSQVVTFTIKGPDGGTLTHEYIVRNGNYTIDWNIKSEGTGKLFDQQNINFKWLNTPTQHQHDVKYERQLTNVCFVEDNDFDYISAKSEKKFEKPIQWVGVSQQFFNTTLINKAGFASGDIKWNREAVDTSKLIGKVETNLQTKLQGGASSSLALQWYYGPNDFNILKKQAAPEMDRIVNLGRDFYAFVRPINVYIIMPVFNFFTKFIASYGIVILLLTLFIRLLTSPLVYTSYLSGAKMKALRPEMEQLKKKFPDQQQYGMEQMKLFREAGVNPLGGCIPALLQIPIFFALYSFFNSNIALRGEDFLWAKDLSSYDSILNFGDIPVISYVYGNHVSLFTLLAVITSFLISLYGMANAPDQSNPALKYMPYIFPVLLLGFFNKLPSALTWYYTVSNIITLVLQWVIQTYIIDHNKILAKIDENRKKPKGKSKWQERLEEMQKQQKAQQERKGK